MGLIFNGDLDGTTTSGYSDPLATPGQEHLIGFHLVQTQTVATYLVNVTLQVSNIKHPGLADDTDWVNVDTDPFSGQPSGSVKDFASHPQLTGKWYRLKFERQTGSGNTKVYAEVNHRSA